MTDEIINKAFILSFIESLAFSRSSEETMFRLKLSLKSIFEFENLIVTVADQSDLDQANFLTCICATETEFESTYWPICQLFSKAFAQQILLVDNIFEDLEFEIQPLPVKQKLSKVLLYAFNFSERKGMFIFTLPEEHKINQTVLAQLEQLSPVFKQTFVQLEQEYWIKQRINERTLALKMSEQRFRYFAQTASDWFWETDKELKYIYLSNSENELKQKSYQHFLGKTPLELRSENEVGQLKKWSFFLHLINQKSKIHDFEYEAKGTQGGSFWISLSGCPNFNENNQFIGYMGTGKDISYNKQREIDLQQATKNAEQASAAKSNFLAVMSHEIRTPMNAVLGMLELLEDTGLNEQQQELHDYMHSSAQLLQGVISDTLDFSKIESGKLELEYSTVNLHSLIKNISKQFEVQAIKNTLTFNVTLAQNVPKLILGDATRLAQILFNILGNAFKFTENGAVNLDVSLTTEGIKFIVKDTGVGISEHNITKLFSAFTQVDSSIKRRQQGVGLGLSIAKELLTLMEGKIKCTSKLGEFTHFTFSIPYIPISHEINDLKVHHKQNKKCAVLSILVAEDNIANQMVVKALLEKRNHKVTLVETGTEAIEVLKQHTFDLILMDMMMPKMDGIEATKIIRAQSVYQKLPIIALTANASLEDKNQCLAAGMNDVITKPVDSRLLASKVEYYGE
ncbi:PAS domain-containing sensor histidine kinase [Pseudoalteromonas denitrificans]|uniref:histidine kinase n=1 Tax=Pseudoalteromonas denitrificans DSM 6059 TaxID=1123010 RepID=A0A1I1ERX5_9GAMM|nr:response regulator [Pseudoalteromonas denitrificans]SFB89396.1 His Kinase A (phospho-acceptor) domain-containing protein [Pseudoalteromonas denitrificans DSM 6059]